MTNQNKTARRVRWGAWLISPFVLLFLVLLPLIIDDWPLSRVVAFIGTELAGIFLLIAIWSDSAIGRLSSRGVALIVFGFCAFYFVDEWFLHDRPFRLVERQSDTTPRNALIALIIFGLPCLWHAIRPHGRALTKRESDTNVNDDMPKPIEPTSLGMWTVESGETSRRFNRKGEVFAYLSDLVRTQTSGRVDVDEDVGSRPRIFRFVFGLHSRVLQLHFAIEWSDNVASLIFFDDAASEYRAKDKKQPIHADDATRKAIAHGEFSPYPAAQCMGLDRALVAIDDYLKSGARPDWLDYDYVA